MISSDFGSQPCGKPTCTEIPPFLRQYYQETSGRHLSGGATSNVLPRELQSVIPFPCASMKWSDKTYFNEDVNLPSAKAMLDPQGFPAVIRSESEWEQNAIHAHRRGDSGYGGAFGCMPYLPIPVDTLGGFTSQSYNTTDSYENVDVGSRSCLYTHEGQALHMHVQAEKAPTTELKRNKPTSTKKASNAWQQHAIPSKPKQYLLLHQHFLHQPIPQQPQNPSEVPPTLVNDWLNDISEQPAKKDSQHWKADAVLEQAFPPDGSQSKPPAQRGGRVRCTNPRDIDFADTMKSQLQALQNENPETVFIARGINRLGFESAALLRSHFSDYGEVKTVYVAHSRVRSVCGARRRSPKPTWHMRAAPLGFIVMATTKAAAAILAEGSEHDVHAVTLRVYPFHRRESNKVDAKNQEETPQVHIEQDVHESSEGRSGGAWLCESTCVPHMNTQSASSPAGAAIASENIANSSLESFLAKFTAEELHQAMPEVYED